MLALDPNLPLDQQNISASVVVCPRPNCLDGNGCSPQVGLFIVFYSKVLKYQAWEQARSYFPGFILFPSDLIIILYCF